MKRYFADLHIHSCLSPCADLDMTPLRIVRQAASVGLDIIAIADHNTAENVAAAEAVAREVGVCLLPAMEVTSAEEVHVLALFGTVDAASADATLSPSTLPRVLLRILEMHHQAHLHSPPRDQR